MHSLRVILVFLATFGVAIASGAMAQQNSVVPCQSKPGASFQELAKDKFACSSTKPLKDPSGHREFRVQLAFPRNIATSDFPWKAIDPTQDPVRYLDALLQYGRKDNEIADWRIEENTRSNWCHAPWFQDARERLRGMTLERGSRPFELHARQDRFAANWAVGFYNDVACRDIGRMWADPAFPKTKDFTFAEGSYAIKLLFTSAEPDQVPYLNGSKEWEAAINEDGGIVRMRLLQVDVAVKDVRPNLSAGWVFGTFIYDAYAPGTNPFDRLVPVGLIWGNDPDLTAFQYEQRGKTAREGWVNPEVASKFFHLPRHNLGLFGRLDGPVDNPKASCLACHGQALDWGRGLIRGSKEEKLALKLLPLPPLDPYDDKAVMHYFRNLGSAPAVEGTQALDYSLQLSKGLANFRAWVLREHPQMESATTDVPAYEFKEDAPGSAITPFSVDVQQPSATITEEDAAPFTR